MIGALKRMLTPSPRPGTAVGDVAVKLGYVTRAQVDEALAAQDGAHRGKRMGDVLIDLRMLTPEQLINVLAQQKRMRNGQAAHAMLDICEARTASLSKAS